MPRFEIRKKVIVSEEIFHEGGPATNIPLKRAAGMLVLNNPFAGKFVKDIQDAMEDLKPLGIDLAQAVVDTIGGDPKSIEGFGKGVIVGAAGEVEHGALWHAPGGHSMRELLGDAKAIVPSTKKVGGVGARMDIPITHINASYVRSHFDAMEVGIADAPRSGEMVVVLVMTTGARVHARSGGLAASDIKGEDGLR